MNIFFDIFENLLTEGVQSGKGPIFLNVQNLTPYLEEADAISVITNHIHGDKLKQGENFGKVERFIKRHKVQDAVDYVNKFYKTSPDSEEEWTPRVLKQGVTAGSESDEKIIKDTIRLFNQLAEAAYNTYSKAFTTIPNVLPGYTYTKDLLKRTKSLLANSEFNTDEQDKTRNISDIHGVTNRDDQMMQNMYTKPMLAEKQTGKIVISKVFDDTDFFIKTHTIYNNSIKLSNGGQIQFNPRYQVGLFRWYVIANAALKAMQDNADIMRKNGRIDYNAFEFGIFRNELYGTRPTMVMVNSAMAHAHNILG